MDRLQLCRVEMIKDNKAFQFKYFYPTEIHLRKTHKKEIENYGYEICRLLEPYKNYITEQCFFAVYYTNKKIDLDIDSNLNIRLNQSTRELLGNISFNILLLMVKK